MTTDDHVSELLKLICVEPMILNDTSKGTIIFVLMVRVVLVKKKANHVGV